MINAPYNFVPVSNQVYKPSWTEQISQDLPFSDSESGTIKLKITARSPIFVRNGTTKQQQDDKTEAWLSFSCNEGKYFIPGTSIKGSIRNVLEIMSFGKMFCPSVESQTPCRRVDDTRHSFRDLSPAAKKDYLDKMKPSSIRCGWLHERLDGTHAIEDWGLPARISHQDLDRYLGTDFTGTFSCDNNEANWNDNDFKTAKYKYENISDINKLSSNFRLVQLKKLEAAVPDSDGEQEGIIVLTGQPDPRNEEEKEGKKWEFVFKRPAQETIRPLSDKLWLDFLNIYKDNDPKNISKDWEYWRDKKKIPVFFRLKDNNANEIEHFGLAYLYKMPTEHSVKNGLSEYHRNEYSSDLADCIFGHATDDADNRRQNHPERQTLRGRLQFSHAWANNANPIAVKTEVLGSPKSSYYPCYIKQNGNNGRTSNYSTYMSDSKISLSGWKRYPVHHGANVSSNNNQKNANVATSFIPLNTGASFICSIRVHNLRTIEIGALLSAITFHDTGNCFHSLGMAKPLGYGKSSIEIISSDGFSENLAESKGRRKYLEAFEAEMNLKLFDCKLKWHDTSQLKELLTMSSEQSQNFNSRPTYMSLDEHVAAKQKHSMSYLVSYSSADGATIVSPNTVTSEKVLLDAQALDKAEENRIKAEKEAYGKRLQKEREELVAIEKEQKTQVIIQEEKEKQEQERRRYAGGLLEIKEETDVGKILSFVKNYGQKIKNNAPFSEEEKIALTMILKNSYSATGTRENKWKKDSKSKETWKDIRKVLGDKMTEELKKDLTSGNINTENAKKETPNA